MLTPLCTYIASQDAFCIIPHGLNRKLVIARNTTLSYRIVDDTLDVLKRGANLQHCWFDEGQTSPARAPKDYTPRANTVGKDGEETAAQSAVTIVHCPCIAIR